MQPLLKVFSLTPVLLFYVIAGMLVRPAPAWAQGETTSAIVGEVRDASGALMPQAMVAIINNETGMLRSVKTGVSGSINFPQLRPGMYTVKVESPGFAPQQQPNVFAGLGQKQTVN